MRSRPGYTHGTPAGITPTRPRAGHQARRGRSLGGPLHSMLDGDPGHRLGRRNLAERQTNLEDTFVIRRGHVLLTGAVGKRDRALKGSVLDLREALSLLLRFRLAAPLAADGEHPVLDHDLNILVRVDSGQFCTDNQLAVVGELLDAHGESLRRIEQRGKWPAQEVGEWLAEKVVRSHWCQKLGISHGVSSTSALLIHSHPRQVDRGPSGPNVITSSGTSQ